MAEPLRVLIVEDSEDDAALLLLELRRGGYAPNYFRVYTADAMREALDCQPWDLIISDHAMPQFSAPAALKVLQEKELDLPFIIVSGNIGEDIAVSAMKAGAHDYLIKDNLARLVPAVQRELREAEVRRARRQAEEERRIREAFLERQNRAFQELTRIRLGQDGDLNAMLRQITALAASTMDVERVSICLFNPERDRLQCQARYERSTQEFSAGTELVAADFPAYFQALESKRTIAVADVRQDPRTAELLEPVLGPLSVTSLLDAGIWLKGALVGVLVHQHSGPVRRWLAEERTFVASLADLVALSLESHARRRAEQRLRVQYSVSRVLAVSLNVTDASANILQAICENAGWDFGALWQPESAGQSLGCLEVWHRPDLQAPPFIKAVRQHRLEPDEALPGRVWSRGEAIWIDDLPAQEQTLRVAVAVQAGLQAAVAFPIRLDHEILGVIELFCRERRAPDEELLQMLATVGSQIGQFFERKRAERELKLESAFRRAIEESIPAGICVVDLAGKQTYVNPAFCSMVGWSEQELIGARPPFPYWPPEEAKSIAQRFKQILAGRAPASGFEIRFRRRNESRFDVLVQASPWKDSAGKTIGWLTSVSDVTEFKETERAALERFRQLQQIYRLVDTVNRAEALDDILESAMDAILESVKADRAAILLLDENKVMRFKSWRGISQEYRKAIAGHSPWSSEGAEIQPIFIPDVSRHALSEPFARVVRREGIAALAFIPLTHQGRLLGKFMLYYDLPHEFREEEIQLGQTIANQIAFSIARKQAAEALLSSQQQYESLINSIDGIVWEAELPGWKTTFVSRKSDRLLGYPPERWLSEPRFWEEHLHPADRAAVIDYYRNSMAKKENFELEYRMVASDGSSVWLRDYVTLVLRGKELVKIRGVMVDITRRKMVEDALILYREIFAKSNDAISIMNPDGIYLEQNQAHQQMLGYTYRDLANQTPALHLGKEAFQHLRAELETKGMVRSEVFSRRKDGTVVPLDISAFSVPDNTGQTACYIGIQRDITERKRAEEALRRANEELELRVQARTSDLSAANAELQKLIEDRRRLEMELLEIVEKERRRIGLDLHDDLGQRLAGMALMAKGLETKLKRRRLAEKADAERIGDLIQQAMNHTRGLARGLSTLDLQQGQLASALNDLATMVRNSFEIDCELQTRGEIPPLSAQVANNLYKIAQEGVTNAIKHGHANRILLELIHEDGTLHLRVQNDGKPFSESIDLTGRMGLRIMTYRATVIGGKFEIQGVGESGTVINCTVPCSATAA